MKVEETVKEEMWRICNIIFFTLIIFTIISCNNKVDNSTGNFKEIDISLNDTTLSLSRKENILNNQYNKTLSIENDSLKNQNLLKLSYRYLKNFPDERFLKVNKSAFEFALGYKDSLGVAASYWDLGEYYHNKRIEDSAYLYYTKAQRLYAQLGEEYSSARLLLQIGNVESNIGNYTGSEISTARAIRKLKKLNKTPKLYNAYNNLGIVYSELGEYQNAINAHQEALEYINSENDIYLYASSLNNIGVVYFKMKNYAEASKYYKNALNLDLNFELKYPKLYAMLIDNLATASLFNNNNNNNEVLYNLKKALSIRQENQLKDGVTISKIHLAEYYLKNNDTIYARNFLEDAKQLAEETNNTRDLLYSLELLSKVNEDSAIVYLKKYIYIKDSLESNSRSIRNKFTKLKLETDKYISETEELNNTIILTIGGFFILIIIIGFAYVVNSQNAKYKRLELIKQRALDNKEIQDLTLNLIEKFEEGAEEEKSRISRELHDDILGRIFGVRLSLDSLNDNDSNEAKKNRGKYIEDIKNISEDIRLISHRLNKPKKVTTNFAYVIKELINENQKLSKKLKFELFLDSNIEWKNIEDNIKLNLYRIIQEAVRNIQKHANANNVRISLSHEKNHLNLNIEDDGIGFIVGKTKVGIGLNNIRIRTAKINGYLEILSKESGFAGTMIKIGIEI